MNSRSTLLVALGAVGVMASTLVAQVDPQARRALETMAAVLEEAQTISYDVEVRGEGAFFGMLPRTSGKMMMLRREEPASGPMGTWRFRIEAKTEDAQDVPGQEVIVVSDGQRYSWVDHERRQLVFRPHGATRGQPVDSAAMVRLPRITENNPLERDFSAATIKLVEQVTVDGKECDVVLVDPGEMQMKTQWTIAREDGLPRRVEELLQGGPLNDRRVWTVTNVQVNQELSESLFELEAPEGYTTRGAPVQRQIVPQPAQLTDHDDVTALPGGEVQRPRQRQVGTDVGDLAPDFELPGPDGDMVSLSSLRGNVVVLDFWGTWCIPCRQSSPKVQKLHEDYKDRGVKVLGLSVRERADENPINYMRDNEYTYGLLLRADDVARQYRVRMYPTFFVIGREGEIVHIEGRFDPETSFVTIREAVEQGLETGAPTETGARESEGVDAPSVEAEEEAGR